MTLNDDRSFLLRHLRNSFVVSDDTGVCEMVIEPDLILENKIRSSISSDADLELYSQSPDIIPEVDLGTARLRSSTVLKLQKVREDKQTKAKVKSIRIVDSSTAIGKAPSPPESFDDIFSKKKIVPQTIVTGSQKKTSLLSKLVSDVTGSVNENPFNEYAKFDGKATYNVQTKSIDIFLPFLAVKAERSFPTAIVVVATAKVRELIGLICWQYSCEQRLPALSPADVGEFQLHLVEDDGEVDTDFPPLDGGEPISKFGFSRLALVHRRPSLLAMSGLAGATTQVSQESGTAQQQQQRVQQQQLQQSAAVGQVLRSPAAGDAGGGKKPVPAATGPVLVTVYDSDQCSTKLRCQSEQAVLHDIVAAVLAKRSVQQPQSLEGWRLEKLSQSGVALSLDMTLAATGTREFRIVFENRRRPPAPSRQSSSQALPTAAVQISDRSRPDTQSATVENGGSRGGNSSDAGRWSAQQPMPVQQQQQPVGAAQAAVAAALPGAAMPESTRTVPMAGQPGATSGVSPSGGGGSGVRSGSVAAAVSRHLALDYKSYCVSMVQKLFFAKYDILLGISAERIEIHPMSHKSALKLLFRQKAVTIDTACLADCQLTEEKQAGKAQFKLTFLSGNDFRQYEFEADQTTAREIVQTVRDIIDVRSDMRTGLLKESSQSVATAAPRSPTASRRSSHFV